MTKNRVKIYYATKLSQNCEDQSEEPLAPKKGYLGHFGQVCPSHLFSVSPLLGLWIDLKTNRRFLAILKLYLLLKQSARGKNTTFENLRPFRNF